MISFRISTEDLEYLRREAAKVEADTGLSVSVGSFCRSIVRQHVRSCRSTNRQAIPA